MSNKKKVESKNVLSVKSILNAAKKSSTNLVIDDIDYKQYVKAFVKQYNNKLKNSS